MCRDGILWLMVLRYFEAAGMVQRTLAIVSTRASKQEDTVHEFWKGAHGVELGVGLTGFQGVLRIVYRTTVRPCWIVCAPAPRTARS